MQYDLSIWRSKNLYCYEIPVQQLVELPHFTSMPGSCLFAVMLPVLADVALFCFGWPQPWLPAKMKDNTSSRHSKNSMWSSDQGEIFWSQFANNNKKNKLPWYRVNGRSIELTGEADCHHPSQSRYFYYLLITRYLPNQGSFWCVESNTHKARQKGLRQFNTC